MSRYPYIQPSVALQYQDREERIPAWARATLSSLRGHVGDLQEQLDDFRAEQEPTQVYYERVSIHHNPIFLPERGDIVFDFGGKQKHHDQMKLRWNGDNVQVMAGRPLDIKPQASNTIELRLRAGY